MSVTYRVEYTTVRPHTPFCQFDRHSVCPTDTLHSDHTAFPFQVQKVGSVKQYRARTNCLKEAVDLWYIEFTRYSLRFAGKTNFKWLWEKIKENLKYGLKYRVYTVICYCRYWPSNNLGLIARKPVFGASDKASFKTVSSATETS